MLSELVIVSREAGQKIAEWGELAAR